MLCYRRRRCPSLVRCNDHSVQTLDGPTLKKFKPTNASASTEAPPVSPVGVSDSAARRKPRSGASGTLKVLAYEGSLTSVRVADAQRELGIRLLVRRVRSPSLKCAVERLACRIGTKLAQRETWSDQQFRCAVDFHVSTHNQSPKRTGELSPLEQFRKVAPVRGPRGPGVDIARPLEMVEVDHVRVDVSLVSHVTGENLGRPWLTVLVDHYSEAIVGYHVSFAGPSRASVAAALRNAAAPKASDAWPLPKH